MAQLRLTRADCQRAASATPSANGSVVRSTMPKDNMVYGPYVNVSSWQIVLQKSKIERRQKSRKN